MTDPWTWIDDDGGALERVLDTLSARKQGGSWMARCPAHDDHKASLAIARGTSQPVLLHCHAGCETTDILAAAGLAAADISAASGSRDDEPEWTPRGPATAVYDYRDEKGTLLFQVLRTADKQFPQRVPDPLSKSGWRWRLGDTRRVVYRLPQVLAAIDAGEPVWIVEGEKDADRLAGMGVCATCNPGGAGKWLDGFAQWFAGAAVTVLADCDAPGRAHARAVARSLDGVADAVDVCEPAAGKDISDHLAAGKTLGEVVVTRPSDTDDPSLVVPLPVFLAGTDGPLRWVLRDLLEYGDRLIWTGGEGLGKSMAIRQLALCAAIGLHPFSGYFCDPVKVLYVDCENALRKSRRQFRALAEIARCHQRAIPDAGFMIAHHPGGLDLTGEAGREYLTGQVRAHRPGLVVIGPLYKLHRRDANEEQAARALVDALDEAIGASDCALVVEAHSAKGGSQQAGRRPVAPAGSRLFLAWPDLGYGIRPVAESPRRVKVIRWRGDRDERRWPRELIWGRPDVDWPWVVPPRDDPSGDDDMLPEEPPPDDPPDAGPVQAVLGGPF